MGITEQKNCVKSINSKIPEYARDYKKEYLFIRGIDKEFKYFVDNINDANRGLFENHKVTRIKYFIKRFLKGQERGKLQDISSLILRNYDFSFIEDLYLILIYENDFEDIDNLDYRDFYELFCKFYDKIVCFDDGEDYMSAFDSDIEKLELKHLRLII